MNNNFSQNAKTVLSNATDEAKRLQSAFIDNGHLILGILRIKDCSAAQIISSYIDNLSEFKDNIEASIKKEIQQNTVIQNNNTPPLSVSATRVLQLAFLESLSKHLPRVGTRHILAGILRLEQGNSIRDLLIDNGISLEAVRNFSNSNNMPHPFESANIIYMEADSPEILDKLASYAIGDKIKSKKSKRNKDTENSSTRYLDNFGKDLSLAASLGKLDKVVGREDVIERVAQILSRRKKNNPILVGQAGVGKSAIAEGLALQIAQNKVPHTLLNKRIFTLDLASVVAGTKYRGQFEERLKGIIAELQKNSDIILFIDEIHTMIGAGNAEGGLDASNIFKPALARGEIQCIGATTNDEYRKHFENDSALERRFQKIQIEPTTVEQTIEILNNIKDYYEKYHKVKYTDKAIEACVKLTDRYVNDRFLPDKAIDALDEAGARCHVKNINMPQDLIDLSQSIEQTKQEKQNFVKHSDFEHANSLKIKIAALEDNYFLRKKEWEAQIENNPIIIDEDDIAKVITAMTGITVEKVDENETEKLLNMDNVLKNKVIGQDEAISKICKTVRRSRIGLKDPNRPIGSFIFVGPTGVGKTYLAKSLAEYLFGSKDNIIRIDMSEYMEKFNVSRLIGSAPGYVGYEEAGQLTEQVRLHPYSIILFDEIEKAHKDVFNLLLQILDDGRLTDSMGRTVDFKNTIIIMTSNVGSRTLQDFGTGVGFTTTNMKTNNKSLEQSIIDKDIQKTFAPEFINRLDDIIFFNALQEQDLLKIIDLELTGLINRLENMGYSVDISNQAKQYILNKDDNLQYGARPIKRAIQKEIEEPLSEILLKNINNDKKHIIINQTKDKNDMLKIDIN